MGSRGDTAGMRQLKAAARCFACRSRGPNGGAILAAVRPRRLPLHVASFLIFVLPGCVSDTEEANTPRHPEKERPPIVAAPAVATVSRSFDVAGVTTVV